MNNQVTVLLDQSIVSAAEHAELALEKQQIDWGGREQSLEIAGYKKKISSEPELQREIDAIATVGRLIREKLVVAYTYDELKFESYKRSKPIDAFNALNGCQIVSCQAAIDRSKFRTTVNFDEHISKGGKKDRKENSIVSDSNQIPFFKWLISLDSHAVYSILEHREQIGLTEFEVESFKQLDTFKLLCKIVTSEENYPDAFHLWTAERNEVSVFLTLEKKLPNIFANAFESKKQKHQLRTSVLRPLTFLKTLGINMPDELQIKAGQFYKFTDVHKDT